MDLYVKRKDTGQIIKVWKYTIDEKEQIENIWSHEWRGHHIIGQDCEWVELKSIYDFQLDEIIEALKITSINNKCSRKITAFDRIVSRALDYAQNVKNGHKDKYVQY